MVITEAAKHNAPKDIPAALFEAVVHDHSLEDHMSTLTAESTWLNISPERRELTFVSFMTFMQLNGGLKKMFNVWMGLLCTPGTLIFRDTSWHRPFLVIHPTPYGVLVRDCILYFKGGRKCIELDTRSQNGACGFRVLPVTNFNEWKVCRVRLIAPYEAHDKRPPGNTQTQ